MGKAAGEPGAYRIGHDKDYRDRQRSPLDSSRGVDAPGYDDVDFQAREFLDRPGEGVAPPFWEKILDRYVLALDIAESRGDPAEDRRVQC